MSEAVEGLNVNVAEWTSPEWTLTQILPADDSTRIASTMRTICVHLQRQQVASFRVELMPIVTGIDCLEHFRVIIKVDPCFWFYTCLRHNCRNGDDANALKALCDNASHWLRQRMDRLYRPVQPDTAVRTEELVSVPDYCRSGAQCRSMAQCYLKHPYVGTACSGDVTLRNNCKTKCGFYSKPELSLTAHLGKQHGSTSLFTVEARADPVRDCLILPRPSTAGHYDNMTFVSFADTWSFVVEVCRDIVALARQAPECVAVNFGAWESLMSRDPNNVECHAHIHLLLSTAAVRELGKTLPAIRGRYDEPSDYAAEDCRAMQALVAYYKADLALKLCQ